MIAIPRHATTALGKATEEIHTPCDAPVILYTTVSALEWRCGKCSRLCPISETRKATP